MKTSIFIAAITLLAGTMLAAGCGRNEGVNTPETFDLGALEEVGELYTSVSSALKKPPTSLKDLSRNRDLFMVGYNAIANGEVVVYWGVPVTPGAESGATDEVLAYKSEVPTAGGAVLMKNLATKKMSPDEFKAAPKPSGATSKAAAAKAAGKG